MATFEITGPDGKKYRVPGETAEGALAALQEHLGVSGPQKNQDGTYGQPPEGFVLNPSTGQMEDLRSPNNPHIPEMGGPRMNAAALGLGQGLGFGSFDEAVAGASALTGGNYDYDLARIRESERRAAEDHPGYYYGGMIPGAVASSVSAGKALGINPTGANLAGTMGRGSAIGGAEGALWGFNAGEGGAANRIVNSGVNGILGAIMGGAAPLVVAGVNRGVRAGTDMFGGAANIANKGRANRGIMDVIKKSGRSVDEIANDVSRAAQEGQPEYRLMDAMGIAGQRKASGVTRSGGDGAEEIAQFLRQRQLDQPNRVAGFVEDAFGMGGKTAKSETAALTSARGAAADTAYAAARGNAAPVDIQPALNVIDDRVGQTMGGAVKGDGIDGMLSGFRERLAGPRGVATDFNRVLSVKQDVQDAIGAAVRAGRNNEARELGKLSKALDGALEGASDMYRTANDEFAKASRVIGAVDDGADMARLGARAADTVPQFQSMTPDQQAAARVGYGDRALAKIEANASPTSNAVRQFNSTKMTTEADAMAVDPALFRSRVGRENAMWSTQNRALGGSMTADNLKDTADVGLFADAGRAIRDAFTGRIGSAVGAVGRMAGNAASGQNEATRLLVARILMSSDPKAALAQALRQETTSQGRRRLVEAAIRSLGRNSSLQF